MVRTYFDASFGALGVRRLLVCNDLTATTVAVSQLPEVKAILVVVNSLIYGGSGGWTRVYRSPRVPVKLRFTDSGIPCSF